MPAPKNIALLLGKDGGEECVGARFHSPRPIFTEQTALGLPNWDQVNLPVVWLCPNCQSNLLVLLLLLEKHDGKLEQKVRREFGNDLRALAFQGWKAHTSTP